MPLAILVMDPPTAISALECNDLEVQPIIAPLAFTFDGGSTTALTSSTHGRGLQC